MMANPWFRMYGEFATDPKVQMLSETDQRRLTMLFCLRCNGHVTLHDEEVTFLLRISNDEWMTSKALFVSKGFIDSDNEILNWDKRQFTSDTSKNRVAAYRERKKQLSNADVTLQKQKSNAIDTDTDTDTEHKKHITQKNEFFADINPEIYQQWLSVRKAKRGAKISKVVYDAVYREAQKANITVEQAIIVCVERNWISFNADWYQAPTSAAAKSKFKNKSDVITDSQFDDWLNSGEKKVVAING